MTGAAVVISFVQTQQWRKAEGEISVFPQDLAPKIACQCSPVWGDLHRWQIEMLIKCRMGRGVNSQSRCDDAVTCDEELQKEERQRLGFYCVFTLLVMCSKTHSQTFTSHKYMFNDDMFTIFLTSEQFAFVQMYRTNQKSRIVCLLSYCHPHPLHLRSFSTA